MVVTGRQFASIWCISMLGLGVFGCSEKPSTGDKSPGTVKEDGDGDGAADDAADDGDGDVSADGGPDPSTFDLCNDGLEKADLVGFDSYITELCEGDEGKVKALREKDAVFDGGDAKIFEKDVKQGDTETSFRLYTSSLLGAKVKDYWAMVRLQLKDSAKYTANFEYDKSADLSEEDVSENEVKYRYTYIGDGGGVDYRATTKFVTLKAGQAYLTATKLTEKLDTMKALTGLIIINKVSATKIEVFTMSDQVYEHASGNSDNLKSNATTTAKQEQERMFRNAKNADKAPALLK